MAGRRWFRRTSSTPALHAELDKDWDWDWDVVSAEVMAERASRHDRLVGREDLVADVSAILFEADLIGLNFETNTDEYDSEAETIVLRLHEANGPKDVQRIAHEEFTKWFDPQLAGSRKRYAAVGGSIWSAASRTQS